MKPVIFLFNLINEWIRTDDYSIVYTKIMKQSEDYHFDEDIEKIVI